MIDEVTVWYMSQGVLGVLNIVLMFVIRYMYKEARRNEASWRIQSENREADRDIAEEEKEKALRAEFSTEKTKMRDDIRRILDEKETAYKDERMEFLAQIRELTRKEP